MRLKRAPPRGAVDRHCDVRDTLRRRRQHSGNRSQRDRRARSTPDMAYLNLQVETHAGDGGGVREQTQRWRRRSSRN